jgi:hypothetical protein
VSSFRFICIAALTVAMAGFVAGAAAAQSATATDQSGKPYLAGLRPPHEHQKPPHATSRVSAQHKAAGKTARPETKRRPTVATNSKAHRPTRLADKINSRIAWQSVEPAAADERTTSETLLQFATEDTAPAPGPAPRPALPAPPAAKANAAPPAKIAASDQGNSADPTTVDKTPPAASTLLQTERFEAPPTSQMRVIVPAPIEAPVTASTPKDQSPVRGSSSTAQMLATLAGAITACIVGWLIFGFGSVRTIKSRRI